MFCCGLLLRTANQRAVGSDLHQSRGGANVGTPLGVPLHPTQLYESGADLVILVLLLLTERRGRPFAGRTFWLYMLLYGASRFVVEFYRGDPRGVVFGVLSTSQFIALLIVPVAIFMLYWLGRPAQSAGATPRPLARASQAS